MEVSQLVAEVDQEIARLQQVRNLLTGGGGFPGPFKQKAKKKRVLSAEAREKIAAAQRKRWAKQKRTAKKAA
jgi:hypothetical protein